MSRFAPSRIIVTLIFFVGLLGGGLLFVAWRNLNARINSPSFKTELEFSISKKMNGTAKIGALAGNIGLRPWVAASDVVFTAQEGRVKLDAKSLRFDVQLLPLLKGDLILSKLSSAHSNFQILRPKGGTWPAVGRSMDTKQSQTGSLKIESFSLEDARVTIIDEAVSSQPLMTLTADAQIADALSADMGTVVRNLKVSGHFKGYGDTGEFEIDGQTLPHPDIQINLHQFPVGFLSLAVPRISAIKGNMEIEVHIQKSSNSFDWSLNALLENPVWATTSVSIPATVNIMAYSTGATTGTLVWNSTGTSLKAVVKAPVWNISKYDFQLKGDALDVEEVLAVSQNFSTIASTAPQTLPDVAINANWDIQTIRFGTALFSSVDGTLSTKTKKGKFSEFILKTLAENTTAMVMLTSTTASSQLFSSGLIARDIEVAPILLAFSSHPILVGGKLSADLELTGEYPWRRESLFGNGSLTIHDGVLESVPVILDIYSKLNLKTLFKSIQGRSQLGLPFDVLTATAVIQNGIAHFNQPLSFKAPSIEMAYTGTIGVDFHSGKGILVLNPLLGSRNLLDAIPGVSQLVIGPSGEFFPLIVDLTFKNGKIQSNFRSIQALAGPGLRIIGNVIRLPATLLGFGKKESKK